MQQFKSSRYLISNHRASQHCSSENPFPSPPPQTSPHLQRQKLLGRNLRVFEANAAHREREGRNDQHIGEDKVCSRPFKPLCTSSSTTCTSTNTSTSTSTINTTSTTTTPTPLQRLWLRIRDYPRILGHLSCPDQTRPFFRSSSSRYLSQNCQVV